MLIDATAGGRDSCRQAVECHWHADPGTKGSVSKTSSNSDFRGSLFVKQRTLSGLVLVPGHWAEDPIEPQIDEQEPQNSEVRRIDEEGTDD
jgi:hypothetical protein